MKNLVKNILAAIGFTAASFGASADAGNQPKPKKTAEVSFYVAGDCEMCKERIESAADIKGVLSASYNLEKRTLTVAYKPKKTSMEKIGVAIAAAGHDNDYGRASDSVYQSLPACCHYERK